MKFDEKNEEYELSTGKKFHANKGLISLSEEFVLCEGYDGSIEDWRQYGENKFDYEKFTILEKREIAYFMIKLYKKWAEL